ncbi:MAG: bifunctional serine/threonine-protein kinase/formylglycine-generating enzyme family protein [Bryobacteraceae bacterium]|nr:bifunctional serine/threonine-protein kinase/formylglycine-generating enzyme family protein [Bryobacteraceae bacterium]
MQQIGRYRIRGEVGRGGMGVVYRAYDPELDREVAIKSMHAAEGVPPAEQEAAIERFTREARAVARLAHPHIAGVYDILREGQTSYIVMELVKGRSFETVTAEKKAAPLEFASRIVEQTASALDFAHQNKIIHRDIKPANILLNEKNEVRLVDFGIARLALDGSTQATMTGPGRTVGTLGYMAPEQIRGEQITGATDQFSLGVVAYQLATGRLPFEAESWIALSYKMLNEDAPPARSINAALPEAAAAALQRALNRDPSLRFGSCSEFAAAFAGKSAAAPQMAFRRAPVLAAVAVVALIAAGVYWWQNRPQPAAPVASAPPQQAAPAPTAPAPAPPAAVVDAKPAADPLRLTVNGVEFEFARIEPGQFMMGSDDPRDNDDQKPRHLVRITRPFYLGVTEVTVAQWHAVMGGAAKADEAKLPKSGVSFNQANVYLARLNARADGFRYRLPAEAEWEYAARAGAPDNTLKDPDRVAWYQNNRMQGPVETARKEPNAWGLFDMLGNLWEWTADYYAGDYYANSPRMDPPGPKTGEMRVVRGGSWNTQLMMLHTTFRSGGNPAESFEEFGFRIVRVPAAQ